MKEKEILPNGELQSPIVTNQDNSKVLDKVIIKAKNGDEFIITSECLRPYLRDVLTDVLVEEQLVRSNKSRPSINAELFLDNAKDTKTNGKLPLEAYYIKFTNVDTTELNGKLAIIFVPELHAETFVGNMRFSKSPRKLNVTTPVDIDLFKNLSRFSAELKKEEDRIIIKYTVIIEFVDGSIKEYISESASDLYLACFRIEL